MKKNRIICILLLTFLPVLCACCLFGQQAQNTRRINNLISQIEDYNYRNFDSVLNISRRLIDLARSDNDILHELFAAYTICWNADQSRIRELQEYIRLGTQILINHAHELDSLDTLGIHRTSMLHATGVYYYMMGDYDEANEKFAAILNPGNTPMSNDSDLIRSSCYYLGQAYYSLGNYDKSMQYFDLGRQYIRRDQDYNYLQALNYQYYSNNLLATDQDKIAFDYLDRAIKILLSGEPTEQSRNAIKSYFIQISEYFTKKKQYITAHTYIKRAFLYYDKDDPDYVLGYRLLGNNCYNRNLLDSAGYFYSLSLKLADDLYGGGPLEKYVSVTGIANIYRDQSKFSESRDLYNQCIKEIAGINIRDALTVKNLSQVLLPVEVMNIMLEQARLYYKWFSSDQVISYLDTCNIILRNALLINDVSRRELLDPKTKEAKALIRAQLSSLGVEASIAAFQISGQNNYLEQAFSFMEDCKGNIILDKINEMSARKIAGIPHEILDKEMIIKSELSIKGEQFLHAESDHKNYAGLRNAYYDKLREYDMLLSEMEKNYPKFYHLKYAPEKTTLEDVRKSLPRRSLLIQYFTGNDKIFIAGITRDQIVIRSTEKNAEFEMYLKAMLQQLNNPDISESAADPGLFKEFTVSAHYLFKVLLAPVLKEIRSSVNKLIIIPDAALCYLPFEILLAKPYAGPLTYSALPYIMHRYRISYDYSASLFRENISTSAGNITYAGYAPTYDPKSGILSGNKDEIRSCSRIWKGNAFLGTSATERQFRQLATETSVLHLATHTLIDDSDPQRSCFTFAADKSGEDGLLYTYELYNMNIPAQLAILSSCETGAGSIRRGEGIISLARAFKYAGCRNILMSLWKVNDQTTNEIIVRFNKNLKRGMPKDKALQKARQYYLDNSSHLHPAFWSSFVLIGNDEPLTYPIKQLLYVSIPLMIILLVSFLNRKTLFRKTNNIKKTSSGVDN